VPTPGAPLPLVSTVCFLDIIGVLERELKVNEGTFYILLLLVFPIKLIMSYYPGPVAFICTGYSLGSDGLISVTFRL
jgi:hypothetical protein